MSNPIMRKHPSHMATKLSGELTPPAERGTIHFTVYVVGPCCRISSLQSGQRMSIGVRLIMDKKYRRDIWNSYTPHSDSGKCFVCCKTVKRNNFRCGHIISFSDGGNNAEQNLRIECVECDTEMKITNLIYWAILQGYHLKS